MELEEIWKWSVTFFVDYGGGLCLLRNTSFNEQSIKWKKNSSLQFPKYSSIFGLAKQIFCHLSSNIGFPDTLGRRKWSYQPLLRLLVILFFVMLTNIVAWMWHSLTVYLFWNFLVVSVFWLIKTKVWTIMYRFLCGHKFSFLWEKYPRVQF